MATDFRNDLNFTSLKSPFLSVRVTMKNVTDYRRTVETGKDPHLRHSQYVVTALVETKLSPLYWTGKVSHTSSCTRGH